MNSLEEKILTVGEKLNTMFEDSEFTQKDKKITLTFFNKLNSYFQSLYIFESEIKDTRNNDKLLRSKFNKYQRMIISDIYSFEKKIKSNSIQKKVRELFRSAVGEYIYKSPITERAYRKPLGYPGDYLIFEMFYNNSYASEGIGYFLDKWILQHALPRGVIYRKNKMKNILEGIIEKNKNKLQILNIGCGSSMELRELISDKKINTDNVFFTCIDQDDEALRFSLDEVMKIS